MKTIRIGMALLATALIAFSCSKTELSRPQDALSAGAYSNNAVNGLCGEPVIYTIGDCYGLQYGTLSVSNDETNLFITFNITNPDYKIQKSSLVIGTLAHVTAATDDVAWPKLPKGPYPPDFSNIFKPELSSYTYTIPLANYESCFNISAFAKLVKRDPVTNKVVDIQYMILHSDTKTGTKKWSTYVEYCKQDCPPPPCGQLTTYTQGGYGGPGAPGQGVRQSLVPGPRPPRGGTGRAGRSRTRPGRWCVLRRARRTADRGNLGKSQGRGCRSARRGRRV